MYWRAVTQRESQPGRLDSMFAVAAHYRIAALAFLQLRTRCIHVDELPVYRVAFQAGNRRLCFRVTTHFDKSEASRYSGIPVRYQLHRQDMSEGLERGP